MPTKFTTIIISLLCINTIIAQSLWQHGKLEAAVNKHYVQHSDGTPFLWIGDTGWGMIQQLTREQIDEYLDNRQALGFNVIQAVAHWSPHGGGIDRSPDNAPNAYGFRPFTGDEKSPNTSEPLIVKGGNLNAPNDYWDHVDYAVEAVKKRNMYLALLPCWASELITAKNQYNEEQAKTYGEFIGKRYRKEPHIIWVLGGDTKAEFDAFDKNQKYSTYDYKAVYRAMAEGIAKGVTGKTISWNENDKAWDDVFFTYHPNGDSPYGSSQWFHNDAWLDANGVEVWKEVNDVYRAMLNDYQLKKPIKPSLFLEGSYEYGSYKHDCGWVTPLKVRRQFYQTFFAGGAGHTYGAAPIWSMRGNEGDYNCGYTWEQALDFPGAIQVAKIGKQFLLEHSWYEWIPNGNAISGVGENESLKCAVTNQKNNMTLVYYSNNSSCEIKNILNSDANVFWFDPRNGETKSEHLLKNNEIRVMVPPSNWEDAILVIQSINL